MTDPDKTLADIPQHQGAIDLTIEGSTATWTLHDAQKPLQQQTAIATEAVPGPSAVMTEGVPQL